MRTDQIDSMVNAKQEVAKGVPCSKSLFKYIDVEEVTFSPMQVCCEGSLF